MPLRFHAEGLDDKIGELLNIWSRAPELDGLGARRRTGSSSPQTRGGHRPRRQVRRPRRVATRASTRRSSTAASATTAASTCTTSTPRRSRRAAPTPLLRRRWTACSWRPASAAAASRARSTPSATRASSGVPFFGICLGMQMAVIEFARNVAGLKGANSTEIDPEHAVPGRRLSCPSSATSPTRAATMRLGAYPCVLAPGSKARRGLRRRRDLASATATATRSTTTTARRSTGKGMVHLGRVARPAAGRDDRAAGPPVLRGLPVPPRVQVAARRRRTRCSRRSSRAALARSALGDRRRPHAAASEPPRRARPQ